MNILFENDTHLFWEEEGIICFRYKVPVVDLDTVRKGLEIRKRILGTEKHVFYGDITGMTRITSEARKFYASKESTANLLGVAVLTSNALTNMIATFFQTFHHPGIPYKFFSNKDKAFDWLHEIMKKNDQLSIHQ